jgi:hypothetical protein
MNHPAGADDSHLSPAAGHSQRDDGADAFAVTRYPN